MRLRLKDGDIILSFDDMLSQNDNDNSIDNFLYSFSHGTGATVQGKRI